MKHMYCIFFTAFFSLEFRPLSRRMLQREKLWVTSKFIGSPLPRGSKREAGLNQTHNKNLTQHVAIVALVDFMTAVYVF